MAKTLLEAFEEVFSKEVRNSRNYSEAYQKAASNFQDAWIQSSVPFKLETLLAMSSNILHFRKSLQKFFYHFSYSRMWNCCRQNNPPCTYLSGNVYKYLARISPQNCLHIEFDLNVQKLMYDVHESAQTQKKQ